MPGNNYFPESSAVVTCSLESGRTYFWLLVVIYGY